MTLDCIAIGAGPSYETYEPIYDNCLLVGCGIVSKTIDLDIYCICDKVHLENVPDALVFYDPCMNSFKEKHWKLLKYKRPLGVSNWHSGAMAITVACMLYDKVGLLGFDCTQKNLPHTFIPEFKLLLEFWTKKGKCFQSLMGDTWSILQS